jgi:hypothetical protein
LYIMGQLPTAAGSVYLEHKKLFELSAVNPIAAVPRLTSDPLKFQDPNPHPRKKGQPYDPWEIRGVVIDIYV